MYYSTHNKSYVALIPFKFDASKKNLPERIFSDSPYHIFFNCKFFYVISHDKFVPHFLNNEKIKRTIFDLVVSFTLFERKK